MTGMGQWVLPSPPPQKKGTHGSVMSGWWVVEFDYFTFFVQVHSYFLSLLKFQRFHKRNVISCNDMLLQSPNTVIENIDPCPQVLMLEELEH